MEKQDAIQFILQEQANGHDQAEITTLLSQRLGAPEDKVAPFVVQTLASQLARPAARPASQEPTIPPPSAQAAPAPQIVRPPVTPAAGQPATQMGPFDSPAYPLPNSQANAPIDPELEKSVLQALMRNTKTSDIVMMVCEQTGMDWSQAQRLVARVASQNRKKVASRQNLMPLILSALALLAGLALLAAGANEFYTEWLILSGNPNAANLPPEAYDIAPRSAFWSLLTGLGLLVGGVVGTVIALRHQFSQ